MSFPAGQAGATGAAPSLELDEAYCICEGLARDHYENFPVASRFLSRDSRRALTAVYAFARQADDFADEGYGPGGPSRERRLAALDDWQRRLDEIAGAAPMPKLGPRGGSVSPGDGAASSSRLNATTIRGAGGETGRAHVGGDAAGGTMGGPAAERTGIDAPAHADAIFLALGDTMRRHGIAPALFSDLLSAFRQDVVVASYETRSDLLDYCRRSANPVGRIVLAVHGHGDETRARWSDAICTGLQLANFWQDVGIDSAKSRIYLPAEDRRRFGVVTGELGEASASPALRALVLEETAWTRTFFAAGRPLLEAAPPALRLHLRLVWHGGMRILERIEAVGGDVLARRPKLAKSDLVRLLFRAVARRGSR